MSAVKYVVPNGQALPSAPTGSAEERAGLRVLHFTTWKTACGIAGYAGDLITGLNGQGVVNTVRPIDRVAMRTMPVVEWRHELSELCRQARRYDVVHIQHDFSFFTTVACVRDANVNFQTTLRRLARQGTATVMTLHTEPSFATLGAPLRQRLGLLLRGRRTWHGWALGRVLRAYPERFRVIVHTRRSRAVLIDTGVPAGLIHTMPIGFKPVRTSHCRLDPAEAKRRLGLPPDCVLLSLFGFVASYKGHEVAVRALKALPANYHLAIIGGPHPEGSEKTLGNVLRLWYKHDPARLRVTGFLEQADLDLYHAATDICLAPYVDNSLSSSAAITWALTSGKPVIASNINAFREINEATPCLKLVTAGCDMELAWQIQQLRADLPQQQHLVKNALCYARENSWEAIAKRVQQVYAEVSRPAARPRGAAAPARRKGPQEEAWYTVDRIGHAVPHLEGGA
jgi:glycosyltransferase involved in cell wall biosynthesis